MTRKLRTYLNIYNINPQRASEIDPCHTLQEELDSVLEEVKAQKKRENPRALNLLYREEAARRVSKVTDMKLSEARTIPRHKLLTRLSQEQHRSEGTLGSCYKHYYIIELRGGLSYGVVEMYEFKFDDDPVSQYYVSKGMSKIDYTAAQKIETHLVERVRRSDKASLVRILELRNVDPTWSVYQFMPDLAKVDLVGSFSTQEEAKGFAATNTNPAIETPLFSDTLPRLQVHQEFISGENTIVLRKRQQA